MNRRWWLVVVLALVPTVAMYAQANEVPRATRSLWRVTFGSGADVPMFSSADGIRPVFSYSYRLSYFPSATRSIGYSCDLHVAGFTNDRKRISLRTSETTIFGELEIQRVFVALQLGVEWTSSSSCAECWRPRFAVGAGVGGLGENRYIHVDGFSDNYPLEYDFKTHALVSASASVGLLTPEIINRVSLASEISITERYTRAPELLGLPNRKMLPTVGALLRLVWDIKR